jgi:hypothetical protein
MDTIPTMSNQSNLRTIFQSTFDGCWMISRLPVPFVEAGLPDGFSLTSSGTHPVVFFFGDQLRGAVIVGGRVVSAPISYNEWGAVVPAVSCKGSAEQFTVVLRMICNYPIATVVGKYLYGYDKQAGEMAWNANHYTVAQNENIMAIDVSNPVACSQRRLVELDALLGNRVVGRSAVGVPLYSHWEFDTAIAETWQFSAEFSANSPFSQSTEPFSGSISAEDGLMVRGMTWKVSVPTLQ